jgi:hypothetical protein
MWSIALQHSARGAIAIGGFICLPTQPTRFQAALGRMLLGRTLFRRMALGRILLGRMALGRILLGLMLFGRTLLGRTARRRSRSPRQAR